MVRASNTVIIEGPHSVTKQAGHTQFEDSSSFRDSAHRRGLFIGYKIENKGKISSVERILFYLKTKENSNTYADNLEEALE